MDTIIIDIGRKIDKNRVILKDLSYLEQDMRSYLDKKATLYYINCVDITINIDSQINRIMFKKCNNITLKVTGLISGLEVNSSSDISILCKHSKPINNIIVDKSRNVNIRLAKRFLDNTYYNIWKSKYITITDMTSNAHLSC